MTDPACQTCGGAQRPTKPTAPGPGQAETDAKRLLRERLAQIRHKVMVLSGKGGVGKSTVATNLAVSLAMAGKRVALLDVDMHGPSIPTMLGLEQAAAGVVGNALQPVKLDLGGGLQVMSIGFVLEDRDAAVIWRGPMKMGVIEQFLRDVAWGPCDYLIIDAPPGTGDEPLSVCQLIDGMDGAVIVTTPQRVAIRDVRRSVHFCRRLDLPVLGIVENMSGFVCPHCGETTEILGSHGGEELAVETGVPFLGRIPLDPQIMACSDRGTPYINQYAQSETAKSFQRVVAPILALDRREPEAAAGTATSEALATGDNVCDH